MKYLFLSFLSLLFAISAWSQLTFTGKVVAEGNQILGSATVILRNSTVSKSTAANSDGGFSFTGLTTGKYTITITSVGYETFSERVTIDEDFVKSNFSAKLILSTNVLQTVEVIGRSAKKYNSDYSFAA